MPKRETERVKFSKQRIAALTSAGKRRRTIYDTVQSGLACAIYASGAKTFFWFRFFQGKPHWETIGSFPAISVENARKEAAGKNAALEKWRSGNYEGRDPFEKQERLTLGQAIDLYIERRLKVDSKNPTRAVKEMEWLRDNHLGVWKNWSIVAIRRKHVIERQYEVREQSGPHASNRMLQFLKAVFNFLIEMEKFDGLNPCMRVPLFKQVKRKRFLQPDEVPSLFAALKAEKNLDLRDFVLLALATGVRKGDILAARWDHVHIARRVWLIPDPKNEVPYEVMLTEQAVRVLADRRARVPQAAEFVFPSKDRAGHVLDVKRSWKGLLKRAGISDFRIHDLRRTLASWQATAGVSLPIIGKSLGHSSLQATEIYAQISNDAVRESVSHANRKLFSAGKVPITRLLEIRPAAKEGQL